MNEMWDDIKKFHQQFLLPQNELPALLEKELYEFRFKFMHEELAEFEDACQQLDMVKAFDALLDLVYVAMGTAYMMNLPWEEGWVQVQAANMRKTRAKIPSDSKRGSSYDVVKPEGWVGPNKMLLACVYVHEHELLLNKMYRTITESLQIPKASRPDKGDA